MRLKLIARPTQPAIDLQTIKAHLRVLHNQEDDLIELYSRTAESYVEQYTGFQLREATYELSADAFGYDQMIALPKPPFKEVVSITYTDEDSIEQTIAAADYSYYTDALFGRITSNLEYPYWPAVRRNTSNAVKIRFICGWSEQEDIPGVFLDPILLLVAHFYTNRSAVGQNNFAVPYGVNDLLDTIRIIEV